METTKQRNAKLIEFARITLEILEADKNWSSSTLEQIASFAKLDGLAVSDEDGCFRRVKVHK